MGVCFWSKETNSVGLTEIAVFVSGGVKLADTAVKGCFLLHECKEGSVNFGISRIVTSIKCCDYDLCNTHPAPGNTYMLYFFDFYYPVLCAALFVKYFFLNFHIKC